MASGSNRRDLEPGDPIGDYEIVSELGSGGMGTVYAARHPLIGKRVAIKVVRAELTDEAEVKARFIAEARALTQISHDNVVEVYSFGELDDGRSYVVMELLGGSPASELFDRELLTAGELVELLRQVAEALEACHQERIIHRDLKPENIFVQGRGDDLQIKLFDFGISKIGGPAMQHDLTCAGTVVGTPAYMAPEQIRGEQVDERCDLYALGVLAYEAFGRSLPFCGVTPMDTLALALTRTPTPLRELDARCPESLETLIVELMSRKRDDRPPIAEVKERLAEVAAALDAPVAELPPSPFAGMWRAAPITLIAAGLLIAFLSLRSTEALSITTPTATAAPARAELLAGSDSASSQPERAVAAEDSPAPKPAITEELISIEGAAPDVSSRRTAPRTEKRPNPAPRRPRIVDPDGLLDPFARGAL